MSSSELKLQKRLILPVHLLDSSSAAKSWSNLGDWTATDDYGKACEALARRIGQAAQLKPSDTLLDIACGYGASLELWSDVFAVATVDAIELQDSAIAAIAGARPRALRHLLKADVNALLRGSVLWPSAEPYDAIVVVDAAYHFESLTALLQASALHLRVGGRIAFTTLLRGTGWSKTAPWKQMLVLWLASRVQIPAMSLVSLDTAVEALQAAGFYSFACKPLDQAVLAGFVRFVQRRRKQLSLRQRLSKGWWKVEATAAAARYALKTGLLQYVLFEAEKS